MVIKGDNKIHKANAKIETELKYNKSVTNQYKQSTKQYKHHEHERHRS